MCSKRQTHLLICASVSIRAPCWPAFWASDSGSLTFTPRTLSWLIKWNPAARPGKSFCATKCRCNLRCCIMDEHRPFWPSHSLSLSLNCDANSKRCYDFSLSLPYVNLNGCVCVSFGVCGRVSQRLSIELIKKFFYYSPGVCTFRTKLWPSSMANSKWSQPSGRSVRSCYALRA